MRFCLVLASWVTWVAVALSASTGCNTETSYVSPEEVLGAGGAAGAVPVGAEAWAALGPVGATATLALLETTDLDANILSYDYARLAEDPSIGLERTATLIDEARTEFPNHVLIDNGDAIQGSALADYEALVQPVACDAPLSIYKAMNHLEYDVAGIGDHEFDYGLEFLSQVTHTPFEVDGLDATGGADCAGPSFPQVSANVFSAKTDLTLFESSTVVTKDVVSTARDGSEFRARIQIGFFGFTPPAFVTSDERALDGRLYTKGVEEVAAPAIEELRRKGADLVVAIIHGGLDDSAYAPDLENQAWHLAQLPGIDAMLMGHSHQVFPDASSQVPQFDLPMVDKALGLVCGVPSVMASFAGQHLGVIKLELKHDGEHWKVEPGRAVVEARPIATTCMNGMPQACDIGERWASGAACTFATRCSGQPDGAKIQVAADPEIAQLIVASHQDAIGYAKTLQSTQ